MNEIDFLIEKLEKGYWQHDLHYCADPGRHTVSAIDLLFELSIQLAKRVKKLEEAQSSQPKTI